MAGSQSWYVAGNVAGPEGLDHHGLRNRHREIFVGGIHI
jgi:hypothetical protein